MTGISDNISILNTRIRELEQQYSRAPNSVKLLAVSKTRSIEEIEAAIDAGQKCFGENYVQEAITKIQALPGDVEWHFIGPIQANKTRAIAENFTWVHSIDRIKIAQRLNDQRLENLSPLNICIEINVSKETTKSGINFAVLSEFASQISQLPRLKLRGLMAIPEPTSDFAQQRANFHKVATAFQDLKNSGFNLDTLSMGMSDDYEAAIAEGATIIRLGTAIFGPRTIIKPGSRGQAAG